MLSLKFRLDQTERARIAGQSAPKLLFKCVGFKSVGIEGRKCSGLSLGSRPFKISLQCVELTCPVFLHQEPDTGARNFAQVGICA